MIPIWEGSPGGIGHTLSSFRRRFDQICAEHLETGRAKSFAFIFYDFTDRDLRKILEDQGVFAQLDRLSGHELSVFYLFASKRSTVESFNAEFLSALGVEEQAQLPCIVFFQFRDGKIGDVEIAEMHNANLIHGFNELKSVFENYLKSQPADSATKKTAVRLIKGSARILTVEGFKALLSHLLKHVLL